MASSRMRLPDYWLPRPDYDFGEADRQACDALLAAALAQGPQQVLEYSLSVPKWRFLCYVAEHHNLALHGSDNSEIERFEPRQPQDLYEFGAQKAVYAAADGIWPMYYAVVNRSKSPSIINACIYFEQEDGTLSAPHYLFSISKDAINNDPYQSGVVYLLPRDTFIHEPPMDLAGGRIRTAQLASFEAVVPLAKLAIEPDDFPFLAQMLSHDDARLADYAEALTHGLPWPSLT